MGLFKKNPNEVEFTGGKKHWTDVIKKRPHGPGYSRLDCSPAPPGVSWAIAV